jgi:hypothetical protein
MKALTLWQPWASLVALGEKRCETRSWETSYRGWLAIHAAKKQTGELSDVFGSHPFLPILRQAGYEQFSQLPFGCVVAVVYLSGMRPTEEAKPKLESLHMTKELAFGDYSPSRYCWLFERVVRLEKPIPARGSQGLWQWDPPEAVYEQIRNAEPYVTTERDTSYG